MDNSSPEQEPIKDVEKLYFLVHPGYHGDPRSRPISFFGPLLPEVVEESNDILESYIEKAKGMTNGEVMVALLHTSFEELLEDFRVGKSYTRTLSDIKHILGKRFIALSTGSKVKWEPTAYKSAEVIANRRGYHIPKDVYSEAFGEYLAACVPDVADAINDELGLTNKTVINPMYSDRPDGLTDKETRSIEDEYDRVQYALKTDDSKDIKSPYLD